jgi:hypothetical protein
LENSNASSKVKTTEEKVEICSLTRNILGGKKGVLELRDGGLKQVTNESIISMDLHKLNNKLAKAQLEHFWCMDKPWAYMDSQDSSQPKLGGSHHLPSYNILCDWS